MDRVIHRELKVKTTDIYCGDTINNAPCPQYLAANFGQTWYCRAFFNKEERKFSRLESTEDGRKLYRCKECIKEFEEIPKVLIYIGE